MRQRIARDAAQDGHQRHVHGVGRVDRGTTPVFVVEIARRVHQRILDLQGRVVGMVNVGGETMGIVERHVHGQRQPARMIVVVVAVGVRPSQQILHGDPLPHPVVHVPAGVDHG